MLNISENSVKELFNSTDFTSFKEVTSNTSAKTFAKFLVTLFIILIIVMFLPWTQNIQIDGLVTSLKPWQRPQTIHSTIPGRIEQWYVLEGQRVNKGDTIVKLSEVKPEYFDPRLLERVMQQIEAKRGALASYKDKTKALENQRTALINTRDFKLSQYKNVVKQYQLKVESDSLNYIAAKNNYENAKSQLERNTENYNQGLISLTKYQEIQQKFQDANAKIVSSENKYVSSQNDLSNAMIELNSIVMQYSDKISKTESDRFSALSDLYSAEESIAKMENMYDNYSIRSGFQIIRAPQDGYITEAKVLGIGETVKEGAPIVSIMPKEHELAAELYVNPVDLPLIELHHKVRLLFDGWPAIVASGWPDVSYGVFSGEIVAVDNMISPNGKYRILISPDNDPKVGGPWPHELRLGSGVKAMALLNVVPVWQELWRKINGFPPEWYDKNREHPYTHDKKDGK